jgi:hypothetical protein
MNKDEEEQVRCPECGGKKLLKLISRVAYHVSEQDRLSSFDPKAHQGDGFYRDTRNIGLHAKKRAKEMGVDLGSGFNEKLERLRTDPGSVFRDND